MVPARRARGMNHGEPNPDAYLEAFMNGFEFVLLAMRGRVQEDRLPPADKARIEAFLDDYARIARAYRARTPAPDPEPLAAAMPFRLALAEVPAN